eukprot:996810-Pyramimonas_sp.AAC.1
MRRSIHGFSVWRGIVGTLERGSAGPGSGLYSERSPTPGETSSSWASLKKTGCGALKHYVRWGFGIVSVVAPEAVSAPASTSICPFGSRNASYYECWYA